MTNENYLAKCKELRDGELEQLSKMDTVDDTDYQKVKRELRKVYALEIIAETLMNIDVGIANIEMQLNRR